MPGSLRGLLRWAHMAYVAETPNLDHDHSAIHLDEDGAPIMAIEARRYLGLLGGRDERADDWLRIASRRDPDGFYVTPLRRAIETLSRERRLLLRDVVPELFRPTDILVLHGIPEWCAGDVLYRSLAMLWASYLDRPLPQPSRPGYLEMSESQRAAEGLDGVA